MKSEDEYKEQLQRQFDSFVNLKGRNFFEGLANYIKFIIENQDLTSIINKILNEQKENTKEFEKVIKKVRQELDEIAKKIFEVINKNKIKLPIIDGNINKYKKCKENPFTTLGCYHALMRIIDILSEKGYEKALSKKGIKKDILYKSCDEFTKEAIRQERLKETEICGAWNKLIRVYKAIYKPEELLQERDIELIKNKDFSEAQEIVGIINEMDWIRSVRISPPGSRYRYLNKDNYFISLNCVHNYFMRQIESEALEIDKAIKWFNPKDNSIFLNGKLYKPRKEAQAKVIRNLVMKHQEENNKRIVLKEGKRTPENIFVVETGLPLKQFKSIKKQLRRTFKDKWGFLLRIDSNSEGILLILTK
jgi:hypothetical protein